MSSVATAKSASEDDREGPGARAKPGDRGSPAKAEPGEIPKHKISPLPIGISRLTQDRRKNLAGTGIDGHTEVLRSLRGHEI